MRLGGTPLPTLVLTAFVPEIALFLPDLLLGK